jgi:hypothetical protein
MKLRNLALALLLAGCSNDTTGSTAGVGGTGAGGSGSTAGSGGTDKKSGAGGSSAISSATQNGGTSGGSGGSSNGGASGGSGGVPEAGGSRTEGGTTGSGGVSGSGGTTVQPGGGTTSGTGGTTSSAGAPGTGGKGTGGIVGTGGAIGTGGVNGTGGTASGGTSGGLPWLKVVGPQIQIEATGQQVILRGLSLQGIGTQDNKAVIDYITNTKDTASTSPGWYPKLLRLPVDTPDPMKEVNNGTIKNAVDYCTQKGLYCIIDLHYVADPYANQATVTAFWTAVAPQYKNQSNVIYEIYNESSVQDSWAKYKPTMQAWVDLVRKAAPKNLIFAGSPSWDQNMGDAGLNGLTGDNIVYIVHMYEEHWGTGPNWNRTQVENCAKYHPVAMTEWGFNHENSQPGINTDIIGHYGQPMLTWLEAMGGSWTAWCASSSWLPRMFTGTSPSNWVLRTGQDNMGGFVKDWLYTHRNDKAPF